jgi:15-cis-phytoene synthase
MSTPGSGDGLDAAYDACGAIARREGRNFHWGFRFLDPDARRAMCALYAFARATDDIVDEETRSEAERAVSIREWRAATEAALNGVATEDPILRAIAHTTRSYDVPREELMLLIDGCEQDLNVKRYTTLPETIDYCRKVAVTVGLAMLAIFRARDAESRDAMIAVGNAFQLTNILRDIPEDARRDRIYLPRAEMDRFAVTEEMLVKGRMTPELKAFMDEMIRLTDYYYRRARPLKTALPKGPARTMSAMMGIYGGILDEIRNQGADVWSRRPRVSTPKKIWIIARTWAGA